MKVRSGFILGLILSLGIHGGFISFVPAPTAPEPRPRHPLHEVDLRQIDIPLPEAPTPKAEPLPPPPEIDQAPLGIVAEPSGFDLTDKELALSTILPTLEKPLPPPDINVQNPGASTVLLPPPGEEIGSNPLPQGVPFGTDLRGVLPSLRPEEALLARLDREAEETRHALIQKELETRREQKPLPFDIRGPAAEREVVFRPPALLAPSLVEGEIELKFWVLPDGTVVRVIPLTRGDATLEAAATGHLKQWKFSAFPPELQAEEQWGTIVFRFVRR